MARRPRLFAPGLLYHVIARGNQRQATFLTHLDYHAYLSRLVRYQERYSVKLYAYCLMPNHVHLLLLQTSEVPLAKFMQGLQQSYTQRFNRVHGKVGHLFQGRYKAIVCERDEYLVTLVRYIHLNPVRARLVEDPDAYPYSGHRAYLTGDGITLIDPGPVLSVLGGQTGYRRFVLAGIGADHDARYYQTVDQQFLGARPAAQLAGKLGWRTAPKTVGYGRQGAGSPDPVGSEHAAEPGPESLGQHRPGRPEFCPCQAAWIPRGRCRRRARSGLCHHQRHRVAAGQPPRIESPNRRPRGTPQPKRLEVKA